MTKPRIFFNSRNEYVHVYPSGDVYFQKPRFDHYSTRNMRMFGSEAEAIKRVKELGYRAERF